MSEENNPEITIHELNEAETKFQAIMPLSLPDMSLLTELGDLIRTGISNGKLHESFLSSFNNDYAILAKTIAEYDKLISELKKEKAYKCKINVPIDAVKSIDYLGDDGAVLNHAIGFISIENGIQFSVIKNKYYQITLKESYVPKSCSSDLIYEPGHLHSFKLKADTFTQDTYIGTIEVVEKGDKHVLTIETEGLENVNYVKTLKFIKDPFTQRTDPNDIRAQYTKAFNLGKYQLILAKDLITLIWDDFDYKITSSDLEFVPYITRVDDHPQVHFFYSLFEELNKDKDVKIEFTKKEKSVEVTIKLKLENELYDGTLKLFRGSPQLNFFKDVLFENGVTKVKLIKGVANRLSVPNGYVNLLVNNIRSDHVAFIQNHNYIEFLITDQTEVNFKLTRNGTGNETEEEPTEENTGADNNTTVPIILRGIPDGATPIVTPVHDDGTVGDPIDPIENPLVPWTYNVPPGDIQIEVPGTPLTPGDGQTDGPGTGTIRTTIPPNDDDNPVDVPIICNPTPADGTNDDVPELTEEVPVQKEIEFNVMMKTISGNIKFNGTLINESKNKTHQIKDSFVKVPYDIGDKFIIQKGNNVCKLLQVFYTSNLSAPFNDSKLTINENRPLIHVNILDPDYEKEYEKKQKEKENTIEYLEKDKVPFESLIDSRTHWMTKEVIKAIKDMKKHIGRLALIDKELVNETLNSLEASERGIIKFILSEDIPSLKKENYDYKTVIETLNKYISILKELLKDDNDPKQQTSTESILIHLFEKKVLPKLKQDTQVKEEQLRKLYVKIQQSDASEEELKAYEQLRREFESQKDFIYVGLQNYKRLVKNINIQLKEGKQKEYDEYMSRDNEYKKTYSKIRDYIKRFTNYDDFMKEVKSKGGVNI